MKKVSLLALILSATTANWASAQPQAAAPSNCQKAFQGFHLGGNIGYGVGIGNERFSRVDRFSNTVSTSSRIGLRGVDGGVGVGYTQRFGNFALGLVFDANWTGVSGKRSFSTATAAGAPVANGSIKARLRNSLQLYARFGYVIGAQAMPFIKLGWDNSQWRHSATVTDVNGTETASKSKRHNGFLWGLGVDFLAWKHVVVGFEYTGTIAGTQKFSKDDRFGDPITGKFRPQYNKFALTAKIVY